MPDWMYRTVSRPLLFRLRPEAARDFSLGLLGLLGRSRLGGAVIDLLGHMRADPRLRRSHLGVSFPSAVGLGPGLDMNAVALPALARFGFGFLEVGPVTAEARRATPAVQRRVAEQALWYPDPPATLAAAGLAQRLARAAPLPVPVIIQLGAASPETPALAAEACAQVVHQLAPYAALFSLVIPGPAVEGRWDASQWRDYVQAVVRAAGEKDRPRPLLVCVPADLEETTLQRLVPPALEAGAGGVSIDGSIRAAPSGRLTGAPAREAALRQVGQLRRLGGEGLVLVGSGGIHEPEHALQMCAAGADLVQVDSGLVYSGPGLPKRINEALLFATQTVRSAPPPPGEAPRPAERTWPWTLLMGAGMLVGSLLALGIAATRVVLPYDEDFARMSREQLAAINDRLLPFLTHDRVTLAGTMVAVGVLYVGLSLGGIRRGLHWARQAVFISAFAGFGSFFLFLGFGYFDPFHAFVTAVLLQFLLLGVHAQLGPPEPAVPNLREDWRWRWSQWGQLLFVLQGCGLLGAGVTVAFIGATQVFVPEDLEFMGTTAETLTAANPRLLPLIAHDRATFGGMLVACGLAVLLSSLWGFRQGCRWLWWTLLASGTPACAAGIGVHLAVGYTNWRHLAPAFLIAVIFLVGLVLSYPYLCRPDPQEAEAWKGRLAR
jgi:dihydroorotate dehydrogenase